MKIQRAYKFKLELNAEQDKILSSWLSILRSLYNLGLDQRIRNYQQFRKTINYYDQANELGNLKEAFPWFAEVPHHCLQQKLKDLDSAYARFFKHGAGFPKFQKRGRGESARFPDSKQFKVSYREGKRTSFVKLPKIGLVKFVSSQKIVGAIRNCTITKQADGFYISFQTEYLHEVKENRKNPIGIDRGIRTFAMTSESEAIEMPIEKIKCLESKFAKEQRKLSKKKKGSNNFKKQRNRVALIHLKITNLRKDSLHKITNQLAKSHGMVVLEDLKIKNMTASASGTIEDPGRNVSQKSGLNRSILRMGWHEFERQLSYKLKWSGGELIKVRPHYTSQTCAECGHVEKESRSEEKFCCLLCGHENHADINAARNILKLGQDMPEDTPVETDKKVDPRSRNRLGREAHGIPAL